MNSSIRTTICACTGLRRANRAVCHLYDLVLAPTGLRATQFMILQVIAEAGRIAQCDLAREFVVAVDTLSRRLAGARKQGLIVMESGEQRKRIYRLTPKGNAALERAVPYWERAQARLRSALGEEDWEMLARFTQRVAEAAVKAENAGMKNAQANQSNTRTEHVAIATLRGMQPLE